MQLRHTAGLAAGLVVLALPAAAQAAPTVNVRIEGEHATLLERTTVTLGSAPVPGNAACAGDTAAGAIEAATQGNWDRQTFTRTILGETHAFANSDYWAEWLGRGGGYQYGGGICTDHPMDGDEVLMLVDFSPAGVPTVFPLAVEGLPARAPAGSDVSVTVVEYRTDGTTGSGVRTPVAGAAVGGATTDSAGHATIHLGSPGDAVFKATKPGDAPSAAEHVTVTAPGTAPPAPPKPIAPDRIPPTARLRGVRDHQVFGRRRAPRTIRVSVPADASGVKKVDLRLTRQRGGRCWYFSGRRARWVRSRCIRRVFFSVPVQPRISYLLPSRLGRGRYVVDAVAIDGAGNREPLARGLSRVVFFVR